MPNHAQNRLVVTCPENWTDRIEALLRGPVTSECQLAEQERKYQEMVANEDAAAIFFFFKPDHGEIPISFVKLRPIPAEEELADWYEARVRWWGTKWAPYDFFTSKEPGKLYYGFHTAWGQTPWVAGAAALLVSEALNEAHANGEEGIDPNDFTFEFVGAEFGDETYDHVKIEGFHVTVSEYGKVEVECEDDAEPEITFPDFLIEHGIEAYV